MLNLLKAKGFFLLTLLASILFTFSVTTMPTNAQNTQDAQDEMEIMLFEEGADETTWGDDDFSITSEDDWMDWNYDYGTMTSDSDFSATEAVAALAIIGGIWAIIMLPLYIYFALTLMVTAKKVGLKNGWFAWIPILQIILLFQTAGLSPWMFLLTFIPFVNIIVLVYAYMKVAERRGFESWLGILIILPIANLIIPGYLAWGEAPKKEK
jgi:hypothetical protein